MNSNICLSIFPGDGNYVRTIARGGGNTSQRKWHLCHADTKPYVGIIETIGDHPSIPQRRKDIFEFFSHM